MPRFPLAPSTLLSVLTEGMVSNRQPDRVCSPLPPPVAATAELIFTQALIPCYNRHAEWNAT